MIKIGISQCDNLCAAELVRVLINHPDVELKWVLSNQGDGSRLDDIVPGIVGETALTTTSHVMSTDVDVVFMCGPRKELPAQLELLNLPQQCHVIDMSGCHNLHYGQDSVWRYGMSEMQRRLLVHDTHMVTLPGNVAMAALLAMMPMARNLMLNSPLRLTVGMGSAAFPLDGGKTIDGMTADQWAQDQQQEIVYALEQCQASFNQPVQLAINPLDDEPRTIKVEAQFRCGVDEGLIRELYEQYYSDHNFVFMVDRPITSAEVENTNKCLISLEKDEHSGLCTVRAIMDVLLKGSAGNAVHIMNLMFGLHEKVGLALKATGC